MLLTTRLRSSHSDCSTINVPIGALVGHEYSRGQGSCLLGQECRGEGQTAEDDDLCLSHFHFSAIG